MDLLRPKSVVDVGCGPGAWLRAFLENGVSKIQGFDGEYLEASKLLIEERYFTPVDLVQPLRLDGRYDLAVCTEVAEHLYEERSRTLVEDLTSAAPAVLFSAAIPGQGGKSHVNEQWPEYWREFFSENDFTLIDAVRPKIRDDSRVAYYFRQNLVLYVNNQSLEAACAGFRGSVSDGAVSCGEWVHAELYKEQLEKANRDMGLKEIVRRIPGAIARSVRRRIKRRPDSSKVS